MATTIRPLRLRHVRRSRAELRGLIRGSQGIRRLHRLGSYLADRGGTLSATGMSQDFTAVNATNRLILTGHGYTAGNGAFRIENAGGALPAGLLEGTEYWVSVVDVNTLQLHLSKFDALSGLRAVAFTTDGTGTQSITPFVSLSALFQGLKDDNFSIEELRDATDIDNLVD